MKATFFVILMSLSTLAFASDEQCSYWLARVDLKQMSELGPIELVTKENLKKIQEELKLLRLSESRTNSSLYDDLTEVIVNLDRRIETEITQKTHLLETNKQQYAQEYSRLSKLNPFGQSATFKRDHVRRVAKEIRDLKNGRDILRRLMTEVSAAKSASTQDVLLNEAKMILGLLMEDYQSDTAVTLTRTLLGYKGNLSEGLKLAGEIFEYFYNIYDNDVAAQLTNTLMGMKKTDASSRHKLRRLFEGFYLSADSSVAAQLAAISFKRGNNRPSIKKVMEIYDFVYENLDLDSNDVLPIVAFYVNRGEVPTNTELNRLSKKIKLLYDHSWVESFDSALMLSTLLTVKGEQLSDSDIKSMLDSFDHYFNEDSVSSTAASILSLGNLLIEKSNIEVFSESISKWKEFYALDSVSAEEAASLTLNLMLQKYGVDRSLLANSNIDLETDAGGFADSSGIFSVTQGMITGDFINLDGNPFTPF